jgi:hypothetical protein
MTMDSEGGLARTRRLVTWPFRRTDPSAAAEGGQIPFGKEKDQEREKGNEKRNIMKVVELTRSDGKTPLSRPLNRPTPRIQTIRRRWNGSDQLEGSKEGS